jgi:8-oxo-dGTP pyrophosphatase MutT (NUDIX family)
VTTPPATRARALLDLVGRFAPADAAESAFRDRLVRLLARGEPAFARDRYDPGHVTASAFVVDPSGQALLLVHHRKLDIWIQPGGHVDPEDADVLEAARREVGEEVGVTELALAQPGIFDLDVHPIPPRSDAPGHEHFDVRFLFRAPTAAFAASEEVKAARWVPGRELVDTRTDASVRRAARKLWA